MSNPHLYKSAMVSYNLFLYITSAQSSQSRKSAIFHIFMPQASLTICICNCWSSLTVPRQQDCQRLHTHAVDSEFSTSTKETLLLRLFTTTSSLRSILPSTLGYSVIYKSYSNVGDVHLLSKVAIRTTTEDLGVLYTRGPRHGI
jgi:hypothetical protein